MTTTKSTRKQMLAGRIISGFVILFMFLDSIMKFMKPAEVVNSTVGNLGYAEHHLTVIASVALIASVLYAIPRTASIGAIILTAHLGGAIASNLRVDNPLFTNTLFPLYIAILAWTGLLLRQPFLKKAILHPSIASGEETIVKNKETGAFPGTVPA